MTFDMKKTPNKIPLLKDSVLLFPEIIIHPVFSVLALAWFISYTYIWNFQFLKMQFIKSKADLNMITVVDIFA
jgi:hypothetical protein